MSLFGCFTVIVVIFSTKPSSFATFLLFQVSFHFLPGFEMILVLELA